MGDHLPSSPGAKTNQWNLSFKQMENSSRERRSLRNRTLDLPFASIFLLSGALSWNSAPRRRLLQPRHACLTCKSILVKYASFLKPEGENSLTHRHCFNLNSGTIIAAQRVLMISSSIYLSWFAPTVTLYYLPRYSIEEVICVMYIIFNH